MANGWQESEFIGNIGKKDTKFTPNGTAKTTLSLAVNERRKVQGEWKDVCTWIPLVLWGSENLLNFLEPGKQIFVKARYESRSYEKDGEKKYHHEFNVSEIRLLGGKQSEEAPVSRPRGGSAGAAAPKISESLGIDDSDVPFICSPMPSVRFV